MSDNGLEGAFSLAEFASVDVSDIQELRSEALSEGIYTFECESAKMEDSSTDEAERAKAVMRFKILEAKGIVERGVNPEELIGKVHTENQFFSLDDREKAALAVGYLKGFVADIGADNSGPLGGDGENVGFLDRMIGHRFEAKIKRRKGKDGVTRSNIVPIKKRA